MLVAGLRFGHDPLDVSDTWQTCTLRFNPRVACGGFRAWFFQKLQRFPLPSGRGLGVGVGGRRGGGVGGGKNQMFTRFHVAVPAAAVDMWPLALGVLEF